MQELDLDRKKIESKFEILESRIAFQEINIEELSQKVISLQLDLNKCCKQIYLLVDKLKGLQLSMVAHDLEDTLPPHY
ncbi:SlyX family protein [Candidatus Profftia tarda]|nr:SlyX family protein [Candidatus Profftia tarda]